MIARRLIIHGRVQGVGFREALIDTARAGGVVGWVRNRRDGSVEAFVQGEPQAVERAIAWCRAGPPTAWVTGLDIAEEPALLVLDAFVRRPTE
jgi:acylphosphatase